MKRLSLLPFLLLCACTEPIVMDPLEEMPLVVSCVLSRDGGWYEEHPEIWMTVNNDHWDARPESAPTDEEIEKMLTFALKSQTGIHWTEPFFIVS